jgi:diguanylate cyclase (GGDEF)-like protein/PAS domain S-box-containing protein
LLPIFLDIYQGNWPPKVSNPPHDTSIKVGNKLVNPKKTWLPYLAAWLTACLLIIGVWLFRGQLVQGVRQDMSQLAPSLLPQGLAILHQHIAKSQQGDLIQALGLSAILLAVAGLYSWHRWREQRFVRLLAQSQERLNLAIDSSGLALWDWNLISGQFVGDARMYAILGYPSGDVEIKNDWFAEHLHPDDWPLLKKVVHDVLKGVDSRLVLEHRLKHKDGHWVWVLGRGKVAERNAQGRVTRMVGTDMDISEPKRLQLLAKESQDLLKNLTDQVPAELFQFKVHPDGRSCFPYVSQHFLDFYGLTLSQVQGDASRVFSWQHPEDAVLIRQSIADTVSRLVPWNQEYRVCLPDGSVHWRSGHAQPQKMPDGSVVCYGAIIDITDRKNAEESVRIAAVGFQSSSAMMVSNADKVIIRVNPAFAELSGYSVEEAVGQCQSLLRSGRHNQRFYAALDDSVAQTGHWEGELWNRRKDGEVFLDWLIITAVQDPQGLVTHYVSVHSDITLRKRTEDEIRHMAFYDPLTQLPNRRLLLDRLQQLCAARARNDEIGAVLFIDLDHFKQLNDTQGHDQGDVLLQQVAQRLLGCVREVDTVARLGGDEFVVALARLGVDITEAQTGAVAVADKILEAMTRPFELPNTSWHLSASIGVAMLTDARKLPEDSLKDADQAMYAAKDAGRNAAQVALLDG